MSWKDRLKRSLLGDEESDAASAPGNDVASAAGAGADAALIDELCAKLCELSDGKLAPGVIDPAGHLFDYGYIDSLTAVAFIAHVEQHYGAQIEDIEIVDRYSTVHAIAALIEETRAAAT